MNDLSDLSKEDLEKAAQEALPVVKAVWDLFHEHNVTRTTARIVVMSILKSTEAHGETCEACSREEVH